MPRGRRRFKGEPLLSDVLADPIVLAVMAGDGTTKGEVETLIATIRRRLANARPAFGKPANVRCAGRARQSLSTEDSGALASEGG